MGKKKALGTGHVGVALVESPNGNGHGNGEAGEASKPVKETVKVKLKDQDKAEQNIVIPAPNFRTAIFTVRGRTPYVQNAFSKKAREAMRAKQAQGSAGGGKRKRDAKDFASLFDEALHKGGSKKDPWHGIPANGIRASLISACRAVGFPMTRAKQALWVLEDGIDFNDSTPLIKITKGEPEHVEHLVRLPSGPPDIRVRGMWQPGWEAVVRIEYDADMLMLSDVANLLMRAGRQVGWGEGRPDSKNSIGMGWGTFDILDKA